MFDVLGIPVFGREEDAADDFATYIMLRFGDEESRALITGTAYSYNKYIQASKVTVPWPRFPMPIVSLPSAFLTSYARPTSQMPRDTEILWRKATCQSAGPAAARESIIRRHSHSAVTYHHMSTMS